MPPTPLEKKLAQALSTLLLHPVGGKATILARETLREYDEAYGGGTGVPRPQPESHSGHDGL